MQSTEQFDPIADLNSAKTVEQKVAENTALETIAKPLVEAGLPEEIKAQTSPYQVANPEEQHTLEFQSFNFPNSHRTELFDDIAHVMQTIQKLNVGGTHTWEYFSQKLIAEGKRVARGKD